MSDMYLGIDLGTASVKLLLIDSDGSEHIASRGYPILSAEPGFAETDTEAWLDAIRDAVRDLPSLEGLRAIGLSGQMHGIVATHDGDFKPMAKAILWADRRGMKYLDRFRNLPVGMARRMSIAPAAGLTATSLLWLANEKPQYFKKIGLILFPKDYIRAFITGKAFTDHTDASGSLLYDFQDRAWYGELMDHLNLPRWIMPEIRPSTEIGGTVSAEASRRLGLPEGVPVAIGSADAPAAMFGSDLVDHNEVQISIGTAAQVSRPISAVGIPPFNPVLNIFEGPLPHLRYRVAAMLNAGIALEWARSLFRREWVEIYSELEKRGLERPLDVMFLPYLTGERTPYMNPEARGAWLGLSLDHGVDDLMLASLLGVACSIRLGLETVGQEGVTRARAGGGSFNYPFWGKLVASMLGRTISVSGQRNVSARGAACLAALSIGENLSSGCEDSLDIEPTRTAWMENYYNSFLDSYRRLNEGPGGK